MRKLAIALVLIGGVAQGAPLVSVGTPTAKSDAFDAKAVAAAVRKIGDKLTACYQAALDKKPDLANTTAKVTFTIGIDGKVSGAMARALDDYGGTCITVAIAKLRFPEQKDAVAVELPLKLEASVGNAGSSAQGGAFASLTGTGDIASGSGDDTNVYGGLLGSDSADGGFGYGRGGFGPGGGGTGWGTIGIGRYGTIGHGSGTGQGYGSGRGRMGGKTTAVPSVSIGQPDAKGDLDKAIIRRYIKRNIQKIE